MTPSLQALAAQFEPLVATANPAPSALANPAPPVAAEVPLAEAAPAVAPSAPLPGVPAIRIVSAAAKGYDVDVTVPPTAVVAAAEIMDRNGFALDAVTGVDWLAQGEMEVVYDYFHPTSPGRIVVRARVPRAQPEIDTISQVFPGANWHERETHDFFGIVFRGHPNLEPLLLPEDATYHPLRKDFTA